MFVLASLGNDNVLEVFPELSTRSKVNHDGLSVAGIVNQIIYAAHMWNLSGFGVFL